MDDLDLELQGHLKFTEIVYHGGLKPLFNMEDLDLDLQGHLALLLISVAPI